MYNFPKSTSQKYIVAPCFFAASWDCVTRSPSRIFTFDATQGLGYWTLNNHFFLDVWWNNHNQKKWLFGVPARCFYFRRDLPLLHSSVEDLLAVSTVQKPIGLYKFQQQLLHCHFQHQPFDLNNNGYTFPNFDHWPFPKELHSISRATAATATQKGPGTTPLLAANTTRRVFQVALLAWAKVAVFGGIRTSGHSVGSMGAIGLSRGPSWLRALPSVWRRCFQTLEIITYKK